MTMAADNVPTAEKAEQALERLTSAYETLAAFNHRNRNQHRTSKWWASFDMLRRHTGKLADQLRDQTMAAQAQARKRRKKNNPVPVDPASLRALWLREEFAPRAYL